MDIPVVPLLILFLIVIGLFIIEDIFEAFFKFLFFQTGVIAYKLSTLFNTKYDFLSYSLFRDTYRIDHEYRKLMVVGFIILLIIFFIIIAFI